jgi:hypothetical protein
MNKVQKYMSGITGKIQVMDRRDEGITDSGTSSQQTSSSDLTQPTTSTHPVTRKNKIGNGMKLIWKIRKKCSGATGCI